MNKITLLLVAALMTMGAMARPTLVKKPGAMSFAKEMKATPGAFRSVQAKMQANNTFYAGMPLSAAAKLKTIARAPEEDSPTAGLNNYVSTYVYEYDEILDDFLFSSMYGAFAKVADGKAQLSLFSDFVPVEGVVESGTNWYSEYAGERIDSITFDLSTVIAINGETGKNFVYGLIDVEYDEESRSYLFTHLPNKKLGAYYWADEDFLYIPDILGIYAEDATEDVPDYAVADLKLTPSEEIENSILLGEYNATNYSGESLSGEIDVLPSPWANEAGELRYDFYVAGFDPIYPYAWLCIEQSEDGLTASMPSFQYVYNGELNLAEDHTTNAAIINYGFSLAADGRLKAVGDLSYFVEEEGDNLVLESDGEGSYCDYIFAEAQYDEEETGVYTILNDLKFTITPVLADVKGVNNGTSKAVATEYFDMQGRRVAHNQKGLVLAKTRMADGTVISKKVVRK